MLLVFCGAVEYSGSQESTSGETGRRSGLKIRRPLDGPYGFESHLVQACFVFGFHLKKTAARGRMGGREVPWAQEKGF